MSIMNTSNNDLSILNVFEPKVRKNIIDFCKDLNNTKADIYVVMARKAACLVSVLEKLSLLTLQGDVISERVLDCHINWSKYKSVIIIDDVIISGTTLYQTITKIKSENPSINIDLFVLGVNNDWYNENVLENEHGVSYIHAPIRYFDNSECIRLSGDIVQMLAQYPVPYNIDFPIYNTLRLNGDDYKQIITLPGWKTTEVLSFSQERNDVFTHTFIPEEETISDFGSIFGSEVLKKSLLKIRTYCRCRTDKKREVYLLTIVPMLIMPPIGSNVLDDIFNALTGLSKNSLSKTLDSNTARLRFVQFVLADLMARRFIRAINNIIGADNMVNREYGSLRYLFPTQIINQVSELADSFEGQLDVPIKCARIASSEEKGDIKELLDINEVLSRPFSEMYYKEELSSRQLVRENGKKVFGKNSYTRIIDRLKRGVSLTELVGRLSGVNENKKMSLVSAFLDRAIDEGIVVPITVEKDGLVYRAFRHGEDVQFGQQEERLCYDMLNVFAKQIGRNEIPKLWMEKMLVLLFQLGEGEIFMPIQTSLKSFNDINGNSKTDIASVKYYLQGPLVVRLNKETPFDKQYLEHKDKADWMSTQMLNASYSPVSLAKSGMFTFDEAAYKKLSIGDNQIVIDTKKTQFAKNIGVLFGLLLANESKKTKPSINSDDLVMLTCSLETKNVIGAMAAEINICYGQFSRPEDNSIYNILKGIVDKSIDCDFGFELIRKSAWYQALNDGIRKYVWYSDKEGYNIIRDISARFNDELYKTAWDGLWSLNMEYRGNTEKEEVANIAVLEGLWLICAHVYYLMLYCLITSDKKYDTKRSEALSKIRELSNFLNIRAENHLVKDILPMVAEFLVKCTDSQYSSDNITIIFDRLVFMFNRCPNILTTASDYYLNTLKLPKIRFFNHALYVGTSNIEDYKIIKSLYESIRFKISKTEERGGIELLMIKQQDDALFLEENQCVFISYNENGLYWLLQLAIEANSILRGRSGLRSILFSNLHQDCRIKVLSCTKFECQLFRNLLLETDDVIKSLPFATDSIYVFTEGNKDIRNLHSRYKEHSQIYMEEHTFYLPNRRDYKLYKYQIMDNEMCFKADMGIITIVDEEAAAVRDGFEMKFDNSVMKNNRYYDIGEYSANGKQYKIVHLQCSKQGNTSMAIAVLELAKYFNPDRMILLGIAGAIQDDVNIGDVVIANDVFYYDSRKEQADGHIDRRLQAYNISSKMYNQIVRYRSITSQQVQSEETDVKLDFSLHVAPIGTGEAVIGNSLSEVRQWLLTVHSKTSAVETEAAGFSEAIQESTNDSVDYLIIRGISDKADVDKDDKYRRIASDNAVIVLKDFINKIIAI